MTPSRIILAVATIALASCGAPAPPADHERRVGSPVSAVSAAATADDDTADLLDCEDECGEPDCSCVEDPAGDPAPLQW